MKTFAYVSCLILLLIFGGCASQSTPHVNAPPTSSVQWNGQVKEFTIRAFKFAFDPNKIEVNLGDKVKITAYSEDVPHGLVLWEFGVDMSLENKTPVTTEFIADKVGTFTFACSVPCGSGHGSMKGTLVVKG